MHRQMAHNDSRTTTTTLMEGKKGEERRERGNSEKDKEKLRVASWCDPVSSCILIAMCEATAETRRNPSRHSKGKSTRIAKKPTSSRNAAKKKRIKREKEHNIKVTLLFFISPFFADSSGALVWVLLACDCASHSAHSRPSCWLLLLYLVFFYYYFHSFEYEE